MAPGEQLRSHEFRRPRPAPTAPAPTAPAATAPAPVPAAVRSDRRQ